MARTADYPPPLSALSDAALFDAAIAAGMTIELERHTLLLDSGPRLSESLCVGTGAMAADTVSRVCALDHEITRRWDRFVAYATARLSA